MPAGVSTIHRNASLAFLLALHGTLQIVFVPLDSGPIPMFMLTLRCLKWDEGFPRDVQVAVDAHTLLIVLLAIGVCLLGRRTIAWLVGLAAAALHVLLWVKLWSASYSDDLPVLMVSSVPWAITLIAGLPALAFALPPRKPEAVLPDL